MKRWVAREREPIEAVVKRIGDARAIDEGRVFIGRARAKSGDFALPGDEVIVHPPLDVSAELTILHRGDGIVAVSKPAGISTIPDQRDAAGSLLHRVAREIGQDPDALHPTSRLDRGVSGVVIFAVSAGARERLRKERARGDYHRRYIALAAKAPSPETGVWDAPIGRAQDPKKRMAFGADAVAATTRYKTVAEAPLAALLSIEPITGRTHQIRVHAAHAGSALLGDGDYGGARTLVLPSGKVLALERVGLHCAEVRVLGLELRAPVPNLLGDWWIQLGGALELMK